MTGYSSPFERYEPRPEYRCAVQVTEKNVAEVADYINCRRRAEDPTALIHPHAMLVLQKSGSEGAPGVEVGRAYFGDYLVMSEAGGFVVEKSGDFRGGWRKCVEDGS